MNTTFGWNEIQTGGGCTALHAYVGDRIGAPHIYALITAGESSHAPRGDLERAALTVGLYSENDPDFGNDTFELIHAQGIAEAERQILRLLENIQ